MHHTKTALLSTYANLIQRYQKNYCFPTQKTLLRLLKDHYSITICRSTLNYHLAGLRLSGYIKTIKRTTHTSAGYFQPLSSAVCLTLKACRLLFKLGSSWALGHLQKLRKKYIPLKISPIPAPAQTSNHTEIPLPGNYNMKMIEIMSKPEYLKKYPHMRKFVNHKRLKAGLEPLPE